MHIHKKNNQIPDKKREARGRAQNDRIQNDRIQNDRVQTGRTQTGHAQTERPWRKVYEIIYLVFLSMALIYYFETTTMFRIEWPEWLHLFLYKYAYAIMAVRIICLAHDLALDIRRRREKSAVQKTGSGERGETESAAPKTGSGERGETESAAQKMNPRGEKEKKFITQNTVPRERNETESTAPKADLRGRGSRKSTAQSTGPHERSEKKSGREKTGTVNLPEVIFAVILCGTLILVKHHVPGHPVAFGQLLILAGLIAGAKGIQYRNILKAYLAVSVPMVAVTMIAGLTGQIENLVYHQAAHGYRARMAFGFVYPTDFCAHLFFLTLCWIWLRNFALKRLEILGVALAGVFCFAFCDTRMTAALFLLTALILLILVKTTGKRRTDAGQETREERKPDRLKAKPHETNQTAVESSGTELRNDAGPSNRKQRKAGEADRPDGRKPHNTGPAGKLPVVFSLFPAAAAGVMILLSRYYNPSVGWMRGFNSLLNNRLYFGKMGFDRYDVRLLGQYVEMIGSGGSTKPAGTRYFFLDDSYVNILLQYGPVIFLGILLILMVTLYRQAAKRQWIHVLVLMMLVLACVIEHHLIEFYYHPFLLLLLAEEEAADIATYEAPFGAAAPGKRGDR